jgi:hypothetical protein
MLARGRQLRSLTHRSGYKGIARIQLVLLREVFRSRSTPKNICKNRVNNDVLGYVMGDELIGRPLFPIWDKGPF